MGAVLVVAKLAKKSGIPADAVQNSFVFQTVAGAPGTLEMDAIVTALTGFYNTSRTFNGATGTLASVLSNSLSVATNDCTFSFFNITGHLDGSAHGSPVRVTPWTLGATGSSALPNECAAALSFHNDYASDQEFSGSTRPRARDRGRVYIGPLAQSALTSDGVTNEPGLTAAAVSKIAGAGKALMDDANTGWAVWSRSKASTSLVVSGWCDDAVDTQRRRGNDATLRTAFA